MGRIQLVVYWRQWEITAPRFRYKIKLALTLWPQESHMCPLLGAYYFITSIKRIKLITSINLIKLIISIKHIILITSIKPIILSPVSNLLFYHQYQTFYFITSVKPIKMITSIKPIIMYSVQKFHAYYTDHHYD